MKRSRYRFQTIRPLRLSELIDTNVLPSCRRKHPFACTEAYGIRGESAYFRKTTWGRSLILGGVTANAKQRLGKLCYFCLRHDE